MNNNIFRRVEEKYLLSKEQYNKISSTIEQTLEKDEYFEETICNIYFDNDNNELIVASIEKPIYKVKVRLRSYGVPKLEDNVYLEIKSKYKKVVGKRRLKIKLKDFNLYLKDGIYDKSDQIMKEVDYLFKLYNLKPSYFIAYNRKSYKSNDNILRLTIDSNLRSRKKDLALEKGDRGIQYFDEEKYIMEIKTLGSIPLWLVGEMSKLKIYPLSFSKYGSIYKKEKEEHIC